MAVTSPVEPAACTPSEAPRMTIAVLMYHSGRAASLSQAAAPGKKFPTANPATRAMMKPASPVSPNDQDRPNDARLSGVAATQALCPRSQHR
jgi:hypothetical protein